MPTSRYPPRAIRVTYPNRETAASRATKAIVTLILIVSVGLMLAVTIGGWSALEGMTPVNFVWSGAYLVIAYFIARRWARGLLPIAAALALLLLVIALIAGIGGAGTSWFDRSQAGFAQAHSLFGGAGFSPDMVGLLVLLLVPVQVLLIVFAMQGFSQDWNVEVEVPDTANARQGSSTPVG
jgi:hypothetical protein